MWRFEPEELNQGSNYELTRLNCGVEEAQTAIQPVKVPLAPWYSLAFNHADEGAVWKNGVSVKGEKGSG